MITGYDLRDGVMVAVPFAGEWVRRSEAYSDALAAIETARQEGAALERGRIKAILRLAWPVADDAHDGEQELDEAWCFPLWGCDTIQYVIDEIDTPTTPTGDENG